MKKIIASPGAPKAVGPYSQAVEVGGTLYVSGQLPIDASTGRMAEGIEAQTRQSLVNLGHILREAGYGYGDVAKTTVLLQSIGDFAAMNAVYAEFFTADMPARMCYEVAALPMGALVEIDAVAAWARAPCTACRWRRRGARCRMCIGTPSHRRKTARGIPPARACFRGCGYPAAAWC